MSTHLLYLSQIRTVLRDLPFEKVEQAGGAFHDVVVVNGEWVFRFPRDREGVARLIEETRVLDALRGRLTLPIPDPVYRQFEPPVPGLAFIGYPLIPGEPLYRSVVDGIASEWVRDDLASQLARFLRSMHAIPLQETAAAFPSCPRTADDRAVWEQMWAQVREKLFPAMRPDARRGLTVHFEAYLDDSALQVFTPCLRHGDFGGSNILWDAQRGAISGVIDFSYCALGDPAVDLASISTLGGDFFSRLASLYEQDGARRAALLSRARFYQGTFAIQEALDGLRDRDEAAYRRGMEDYV